MIPVIGAPFVTNPRWITRLVNSVDFPVKHFVIINNNGKGEFDSELDALVNKPHSYIENIKVCHLPANLGVAGAWNLIIKCYMLEPYWIISNDDVAFKPGLLAEIHQLMSEHTELGMIHPNPGDFNLGAWDLFVIRDIIVQQFGLFDENTYPAYCEDADYIMRLAHRPIQKWIGSNYGYLHGDADSSDYYAQNAGSQTKKSSTELTAKLDQVNITNFEYLTKKWGPGWRNVQPTQNPFDNMPVSTTTFDLEFVRNKHLGF